MGTPARSSFIEDIEIWADRTSMHEAASHGSTLLLKQLIEGGMSVNMGSVDNITPLHDACVQAHPNCARMLLEAGAQVDVRNIHGNTALCYACAAGSLECAKLLLDYGAKINPSLTALTASPLHEACIKGNVDIVRLVIAKGASLEAFDIYFGTPLHTACAREHVNCAEVLLNAGLEMMLWLYDDTIFNYIRGAKVNAAKFHETAMHHAARVGMVDMIELLVEYGGNVNVRDNLEKKPIDYTLPGSSTELCLKTYESTPLSLQQLCRITLRTMLGTRAEEVISQKLDVSHIIRSYLLYE